MTWDGEGSDANWTTSQNWDTNTIPPDFSFLVFDDDNNGKTNATLGDDFVVRNMTFAGAPDNASAFTINTFSDEESWRLTFNWVSPNAGILEHPDLQHGFKYRGRKLNFLYGHGECRLA